MLQGKKRHFSDENGDICVKNYDFKRLYAQRTAA